jgi:ankyrin repeat protein
MLAAALDGNIPAMEVLVQHGADVNNNQGSPWRNSASSDPLCIAACQGRVAVVSWLLQQGVTGEARGLGLALILAAEKADATVIRVLLSYHPTQAILPSYGPSALLHAVQYGRAAAAEELLNAGVPSTAQAFHLVPALQGEGGVRELLRKHLSKDEAYEQAPAIIAAASQHGHGEFAELLREARAAAAVVRNSG